MNQEDDQLLNKTYRLAEENNKLLRSMRRSQRIVAITRIVYWVVVLGAGVGVFYYLQPYLGPLLDSYSGFRENLSDFSNLVN